MTGSRFIDVLLSITTIALVTTLILPGRQTPAVIREGGRAFGGVLREAQGR